MPTTTKILSKHGTKTTFLPIGIWAQFSSIWSVSVGFCVLHFHSLAFETFISVYFFAFEHGFCGVFGTLISCRHMLHLFAVSK